MQYFYLNTTIFVCYESISMQLAMTYINRMNIKESIRFSRKIDIDRISASTSKTTHLPTPYKTNDHQTTFKTTDFKYITRRKPSTGLEAFQSLKVAQMLPKLQSYARDLQRQEVNKTSDFRRSSQASHKILLRTQKPQIFNWTKMTHYDTPSKQHTVNDCQRFKVVNKQGKRAYNQDRFVCKIKNSYIFRQKHMSREKNQYDLYCIFDGHGGTHCAEFLKDNFPLYLSRSRLLEEQPQEALKEAFQKSQNMFLATCQQKKPVDTSGSCAVVCLIMGEKICVANLGDSRALLLSQDSMLQLTKDHKPHQLGEKMRILKNGGKIYKQQEGQIKQIKIFRQMRIFPGNLNVSRTIGDIQVKMKKFGGLPGMISPVPEVATYFKNNYQLLLLGSDGLFEAFTNQQIGEMYGQFMRQNGHLSRQKQLGVFIEKLGEQAEGQSSDNITIIGVLLC